MPPRLRMQMRIAPPFPIFSPVPLQRRSYADTAKVKRASGPRYQKKEEKDVEEMPSNWHQEIKTRLGKCIMFGCSRDQVQEIGTLLGEVAKEWRDLTAAAGGFIVDGNRGFVDQRLPPSEETTNRGYVSNFNHHQYIESSRLNWLTYFENLEPEHASQWRELLTSKRPSFILEAFRASYKFPLKYPDTVSAYHKIQYVPSEKDKTIYMSSIVISHKQKRVVASTRETAMLYRRQTQGKARVPPFMRDTFEKIWRQQEDGAKVAKDRIFEFLSRVRKFEEQTWDKKGAVEDTGAVESTGTVEDTGAAESTGAVDDTGTVDDTGAAENTGS
ncbi:hypothetical protein F5B19DRAFT_498225 [Rostrohypoxylon terebratum]|nr:hypothetical protein F5B19DRAFT_498225 [Rostrohypoxylon terebratum]